MAEEEIGTRRQKTPPGEMPSALERARQMAEYRRAVAAGEREPFIQAEFEDAWYDGVGDIFDDVISAFVLGSIIDAFTDQLFEEALEIPGIQDVVDRVAEIESQINTTLDTELIQTTVSYARVIHNLALASSADYRQLQEDLFTKTAEMSRSVFQETSTLMSALQLYRYAVMDLTGIEGESTDVAEQQFFGGVLGITEMVNINARAYRLNPGKFWNDLDQRYLTPAQTARNAKEKENREAFTRLRQFSETASDAAEKLRKRFNVYTSNLAPFVSREQMRDLDRIRRDFRTKVELPIRSFTSFMQDTWPEERDKIDEMGDSISDMDEELEKIDDLTGNPDNLTDTARRQQQTRFSLIMANVLNLEDNGPPVASQSRSEVEEQIQVKLP